ncbi:MAG: 4-alpha-glucanotransferase, partial [Clostridia bacterium]|nr:4-alpha-glucanotransferase [Clostridia bacterium]
MKRASGVLMPVFSLPGDYSVGSFGKEALGWIDFLHECGFSYWQVLPFGVTDSFHSPYQSSSAFGGNPFYVDLELLQEEGLLTFAELKSAKQKGPYICEYDRLEQERMVLLAVAASRADNKQEIESFIKGNPYLEEFCRFMALREQNNNACFTQWTVNEPAGDKVFVWQFIQFHFHKQWKKVLEYAHIKGISIIGDLPIYVSFDSCDVWCHKDQFMLDETGFPTHVAGCPPDYFAKEGQLWGNPLYRWDMMKKDGFSWWKDRLSHQLTLFDGVRLDHFRGFEAFWAVPSDAKTAVSGSWVKGPGIEFVNTMKEVAGDKLIIAEDLGEITPQVVELLKQSELPGMRVFQFAFLGGDNPHLPHNYIQNCVAYSGTHDNNTLLGYLWEMDEASRKKMLSYCGFKET